jgi:tetratricopeptide (TPR) repeat protein
VSVGLTYYEMKRFPEAIAAFEAARIANPGDGDSEYQLGVMLKDGGRPRRLSRVSRPLPRGHPTRPATGARWVSPCQC